VALIDEDLWSYSHKTESDSLRKYPYDHWLTNKAYLSAIAVTGIFRSFTYKMAAKTSWHRCGTILRHCHLMYTSALFVGRQAGRRGVARIVKEDLIITIIIIIIII